MPFYISNFTSIRPAYELAQSEIAAWLAAAHAQAQKVVDRNLPHEDFEMRIGQWLQKLAPKIEKRGFEVADILHRDWDKMEIFPLGDRAEGRSIDERTDFFHRKAVDVLERFYSDAPLPDHLIHVTCTGYAAPSCAQRLAAKRGGAQNCVVTHAYHMGCSAAIPAIRIGMGSIACHPHSVVDVVHTELGSLHLDPSKHSVDQLVIQSLFADGYIRYQIRDYLETNGLEVVRLQDEIIPESHHMMDWRIGQSAMRFTLLREVPTAIGGAIRAYIERLLEGRTWSDCYFAIHPGGIKIIDQIAQILSLQPWQYGHSLAILASYGNISSATTPHIWQRLLDDPQVPLGATIISLAFGPGLTICGGVLIKR